MRRQPWARDDDDDDDDDDEHDDESDDVDLLGGTRDDDDDDDDDDVISSDDAQEAPHMTRPAPHDDAVGESLTALEEWYEACEPAAHARAFVLASHATFLALEALQLDDSLASAPWVPSPRDTRQQDKKDAGAAARENKRRKATKANLDTYDALLALLDIALAHRAEHDVRPFSLPFPPSPPRAR